MFSINNLHKNYGDLPVLKGIDLKIKQGQITVFLGPSGCGKTTLLRVLAGLMDADKGSLSGFSQQVSYVFQRPRLLPWLTVYQNIELVLREKVVDSELPQVIKGALEKVELLDVCNDYPNKLSGGMQQRVAIARALAYPSQLMYLDEPFQSLDFDLKQRLMSRLLPLWTKHKYTVFIVTHDIHVAVTLGDVICLLSKRPSVIRETLVNPIDRKNRVATNKKELTELENIIYYSLANN